MDNESNPEKGSWIGRRDKSEVGLELEQTERKLSVARALNVPEKSEGKG